MYTLPFQCVGSHRRQAKHECDSLLSHHFSFYTSAVETESGSQDKGSNTSYMNVMWFYNVY